MDKINFYERVTLGKEVCPYARDRLEAYAGLYAARDQVVEVEKAYDCLRAKVAAAIGSTVEEIEHSRFPSIKRSACFLKEGEQLKIHDSYLDSLAAKFMLEQVKPEYTAAVEDLVAKMKDLYAAMVKE